MSALIVVDMQNDFMPGGPLGVPGADTLIPIIQKLMKKFSLCIATQDWHPKGHISFASSHPGKKPGDRIDVHEVSQTLWPVHCVQNTPGAQLVAGLEADKFSAIFLKGSDPFVDSYSTFFDNERIKETGLMAYLRNRGITDLYFTGVAMDYCVLYSVLDAIDQGFRAFVIVDACKGIDLDPGDIEKSLGAMVASGATLLTVEQVYAKPQL